MVDVEKRERQGEIIEVIPPEVALPQFRESGGIVLFDSADEKDLLRSIDEGQQYGEPPSVFNDPRERRLLVGLEKCLNGSRQLKDGLGVGPNDGVYFLILSGRAHLLLEKGQVTALEPLGFIGPLFSDNSISGNFEALVIGLRDVDFRSQKSPPVAYTRISLGQLKPTNLEAAEQEPRKLWFTGSWGIFEPGEPGYSRVVSMGLAYAPWQITDEFHEFGRQTFQLFVPLPTKEQPQPKVTIRCRRNEIDGIPAFLHAETIGGYEMNPLYATLQAAHQKVIEPGTLIFMLNVMDTSDSYRKLPRPDLRPKYHDPYAAILERNQRLLRQ